MAKSKHGRNKRKGYVSKGKHSNVASNVLAGMRQMRPAGWREANQLDALLKGKSITITVATGDPARPFVRQRINGKQWLEDRKNKAYKMKGEAS